MKVTIYTHVSVDVWCISEKPETQKSSKVKSTLHKWRFGHFEVIELEGHSDLVTDADMDEGLLVTSRLEK